MTGSRDRLAVRSYPLPRGMIRSLAGSRHATTHPRVLVVSRSSSVRVCTLRGFREWLSTTAPVAEKDKKSTRRGVEQPEDSTRNSGPARQGGAKCSALSASNEENMGHAAACDSLQDCTLHDAGLAEETRQWATLPEAVRTAILAVVRSVQ